MEGRSQLLSAIELRIEAVRRQSSKPKVDINRMKSKLAVIEDELMSIQSSIREETVTDENQKSLEDISVMLDNVEDRYADLAELVMSAEQEALRVQRFQAEIQLEIEERKMRSLSADRAMNADLEKRRLEAAEADRRAAEADRLAAAESEKKRFEMEQQHLIAAEADRELERRRLEAAEADRRAAEADRLAAAESERIRLEIQQRQLESAERIEQMKLEAIRLQGAAPQGAPPAEQTFRRENVLPRLNIPVFNGDSAMWLNFRDLFTALVGTNTSLNSSQKLQYLKNALKDQPFQLISNLPTTNVNFKVAWDLLEERYNSPRDLVTAYVKRLLDLPFQKIESSENLRSLVDSIKEILRSLEILERKEHLGEDIITVLLSQKLTPETRKDWTLTFKDKQFPELNSLLNFLERRAEALFSSKPKETQTVTSNQMKGQKRDFKNRNQKRRGGFVATAVTQKIRQCFYCNTPNHSAYQCDRFLTLSPPQRKQWATSNNRCLICLNTHPTADCRSKYNCNVCHERHNTLLHTAAASRNPTSVPVQQQGSSVQLNPNSPSYSPLFSACSTTPNMRNVQHGKETLLYTAMVLVQGRDGSFYKCRGIVDCGSMTTLISERAAKQLWLSRKRSKINIVGINETAPARNLGEVELTIKSLHDDDFIYKTQAIVLNRLANHLPLNKVDGRDWHHLRGLNLADPQYDVPAAIDLILGQDVFSEVLLPEQRIGDFGHPRAFNSRLGWLIGGTVQSCAKATPRDTLVNFSIHHMLQTFWEVDKLPDDDSKMTPTERWAEDHFQSTYKRLDNGSYEVRLPVVGDRQSLGDSKGIALKRLESVEQRLVKNSELRSKYNDFMSDYESLGHMKEITSSSSHLPFRNFIPHHAVVKEDSLTTKVRVVFDAGAKTSNNISLNSLMVSGPVVQNELFDILVNFRTHRIALVSDIVKMYRAFKVNKLDTPLQSIVWRESPDIPVKVFELSTITYGLRPSSFLATRCLAQLAKDESIRFPLASEVLSNQTYIDDIISGGQSVPQVLQLRDELCGIMDSANLSLNKWSSNSVEILESFPDDVITQSPHNLDNDDVVKILGVVWLPKDDYFSFRASSPTITTSITKRQMLGQLARLFDPLGIITPVSVWAKVQIQRLWKMHSDWDAEVPSDIVALWILFQEQAPMLTNIRIPRFIGENDDSLFLFGFCDASVSAYCACVYALSVRDGQLVSSLIAAKSKVAPVKPLTIPRLELSAAVLLSKLVIRIANILGIPNSKIRLFSDSQIVLSWLASPALSWNMYVSNRVSLIQKSTEGIEWLYVNTTQNPADIGTRGMLPAELLMSDTWFVGPEFIRDINFNYDKLRIAPLSAQLPERRKLMLVTTVQDNSVSSIFKLERLYSDWVKLQRVTAYVFRFIANASSKFGPKLEGPLNPGELKAAVMFHVRKAQIQGFPDEYNALSRGDEISNKSSLRMLTPFKDECNVLRVGGRLGHSPLPYEMKHPVLLPRRCWLTELIVNYVHRKRLHAGAAVTLTLLRSIYWVIGGITAVKAILRKCVVCARYRQGNTQQLMGPLPPARVWPNPSFSVCGTDFCGPFMIRAAHGRKFPAAKAYIAIFVCFSSKAVHLELVSGLSTQDFINAFRRFVSRRGMCKVMYSDHGTNFVGANRQLRVMLRAAISSQAEHIQRQLQEDGVEWRFIPVEAPHFGGLWESNVKSVKRHLVKVSRAQLWTIEQLSTLLCEIEACLNSRPLMPLNDCPDSLEALTPAHFLIGRHISVVPATAESCSVSLKNFRALTIQLQEFWSRWSQEYLSSLIARPKWLRVRNNVLVGDLVVIKERLLAPSRWKLARVLGVLPGSDNLNRVLTLRTQSGIIQRAIHSVIVLCSEKDPRIE